MTFQASLVSQMVKNLSAMQETQPLISLWACAWPSTSRLGTDHGQAMMPLKWKAGKSVIQHGGGKDDKGLVSPFLYSKTIFGFICSFALGSP